MKLGIIWMQHNETKQSEKLVEVDKTINFSEFQEIDLALRLINK